MIARHGGAEGAPEVLEILPPRFQVSCGSSAKARFFGSAGPSREGSQLGGAAIKSPLIVKDHPKDLCAWLSPQSNAQENPALCGGAFLRCFLVWPFGRGAPGRPP